MKKILLIGMGMFFTYSISLAQSGSDCSQPSPFCTGTNYNFPANYDPNDPGAGQGPQAQPGPDYDCLAAQPNPVWYFMQVENSGNIQIGIMGTNNGSTPTNDIDYICYGPFSSLSGVCTGQLNSNNTVGCSYSSSATEQVNIPNAQSGEYYLILLTNYSNTACNIIFSQTGGTGTTDCGVLSNAQNDGPVCEGEPVNFTGDVSNASNPTVQWFHLPNFTTPVSTSNPFTIASATSVDAGSYAFVVMDNATFEYDTSYTTLVVNPIPAAPSFTSTAPACQGSTVTLTPTNIIPGATYNWSGTNGYTSNQTVASFSNATAALFNGTYTLVVTVAGCVSPPYSQALNIYPTIIPVISGPTEACEGGTIPLSVTNGSSFVSFAWNTVPGANPQQVPPGTYVVSATDQNNCVTSSAPYVVDVIDNPLDITGPDHYCEGFPITLSATPGKQSYLWSTASTDATTIVDLEDGPITVTVVSIEGCERSDTLNVTKYDTPEVAYSPNKVCEGGSITFDNLTQLSDTHGSTQASWAWSFGHLDNGVPSVSTDENPSHAFPQAGTYQVTLAVISNNGCADTLSAPFLVVDPPSANFSFESFCFAYGGFTNITTPGNLPIENSTWTFGDSSPIVQNNDATVYHTYPSIATYTVNLSVTDTAGCVSDTTMDITLKDTPVFEDIPNVITPNGDNINDSYSFLPDVADCYNYTFTVFNRWGAKVFQTEGASQKAFGEKSMLGSKLQDGVYFWTLTAYGVGAGQGEEVIRKGSITIAGTK